MRICTLTILAFSFSACAPVWVKPGADQQDFNVDNSACVAQGYRSLPPAVTQVPSSHGDLPPRYVMPDSPRVDHNAKARNQLYRECMASRGWALQQK